MRLSIVLTVVQVAGLLVLVYGLALWSVPLALVCGGGLIVVCCELAERRREVRAVARLGSVPRPGRGEAL